MLSLIEKTKLLEASRFKSKRDLEVLLAARFEKPDVPNTLRKLPQARPAPVAETELSLALETSGSSEGSPPCPPPAKPSQEPRVELRPSASASARPSLGPLGAGRYKLQLTASQSLHDKLQQARDLLELHHEDPYGRGGLPITSNIHVMCRSHNQLLADRDYGRRFIQKRVKDAQRARGRHQLVPELATPSLLTAHRLLFPDTVDVVHRE